MSVVAQLHARQLDGHQLLIAEVRRTVQLWISPDVHVSWSRRISRMSRAGRAKKIRSTLRDIPQLRISGGRELGRLSLNVSTSQVDVTRYALSFQILSSATCK